MKVKVKVGCRKQENEHAEPVASGSVISSLPTDVILDIVQMLYFGLNLATTDFQPRDPELSQ
jgi:hypothetical protein